MALGLDLEGSVNNELHLHDPPPFFEIDPFGRPISDGYEYSRTPWTRTNDAENSSNLLNYFSQNETVSDFSFDSSAFQVGDILFMKGTNGDGKIDDAHVVMVEAVDASGHATVVAESTGNESKSLTWAQFVSNATNQRLSPGKLGRIK